MKYYKELNKGILRSYDIKSYRDYKKIHYLNVASAFDIESTSTEVDGEKRAFMYLWAFGLDSSKEVYYGRTWNEFLELALLLRQAYNLSSRKRLVVYVHNLAYEFQFMRKYFQWFEVF